MLVQNKQVKLKTSLDKIQVDVLVNINLGRLKSTESTARGRAQDTGDVALVPSPSVGQQRSVVYSSCLRMRIRPYYTISLFNRRQKMVEAWASQPSIRSLLLAYLHA